MAGPLTITPARSSQDLDAARTLIQAYVDWLGVDLTAQAIESELAGLPGAYAPPGGTLLLAHDAAGQRIGCVALRGLSPERCEMKRLFVSPAGRGTGAGRALAESILREAAALGYREMVLDTLPRLTEAMALYRRLGFEPIPAYYDSPVPGAVYLRRSLP